MKTNILPTRNQTAAVATLQQSWLAVSICLLLVSAHAGPFINLDFESSPDFPAGDFNFPYTVYADALPGWTVHIGDTIQDGAFANEFLIDAPGVALMTSSANFPAGPIEGQKNAYLQSTARVLFDPTNLVNVAISQAGLVPVGSQFLRFKARNPAYYSFAIPPGPFDVQLGGQRIPLIPIRSSAGAISWDVEYAGEVAPWAGQTVELSIRVVASTNWGNPIYPEGWALVDSISFQRGVRLNIAVTSTNTLLLSWPTNVVDSFPFVLHQSPDLRTNSWEAVTNVPTYSSGTNSVTLPLPPVPRYYRLKIVP